MVKSFKSITCRIQHWGIYLDVATAYSNRVEYSPTPKSKVATLKLKEGIDLLESNTTE